MSVGRTDWVHGYRFLFNFTLSYLSIFKWTRQVKLWFLTLVYCTCCRDLNWSPPKISPLCLWWKQLALLWLTSTVKDILVLDIMEEMSMSINFSFFLLLVVMFNRRVALLSPLMILLNKVILNFRYIDMAETLCQKRALEAFRLDPEKWGGK